MERKYFLNSTSLFLHSPIDHLYLHEGASEGIGHFVGAPDRSPLHLVHLVTTLQRYYQCFVLKRERFTPVFSQGRNAAHVVLDLEHRSPALDLRLMDVGQKGH